MQINQQLINWWINLDPLSEEETILVNSKRKDIAPCSDDVSSITQKVVDLLLYPNITSDDYTISINSSLTSIINEIFEKNSDNNTFIISTDKEHFSSSKPIEKHPHKYILSHENEIRKNNITQALMAAEDYEKVLVFIIGTQKGTGEITPQEPIDTLIKSLKANGKEVIAVSDDVHSWFFTPRNYTHYDYILHTAHSLPTFYDMGVCIHRKNVPEVGVKNIECIMDWLDVLAVMLKRKEKILMFQKVITESAFGLFAKYNVDFVKYCNTNFFTIKIPHAANQFITEEEIKNMGELHFYYERVGHTGEHAYISARGQQFIVEPEKLMPGLRCLGNMLDKLHNKGVL